MRFIIFIILQKSITKTLKKWLFSEKKIAHWRRSAIFIVNFEHISHLLLVFLLLNLNMQLPAGFIVQISAISSTKY